MMRPQKLRRSHLLIAIFSLAGLTGIACGDDANTTTGAAGANAQGGNNTGANNAGGNNSGGNSAGGSSAGGNSAGGNAQGGQGQGLIAAPCGNQTYQCGDTLDNDGDGLFDSDDPDCLGPCDDTEDGYHPELPGFASASCRVDCFWDGGNGVSESCYWDHHCDHLSVDPNYYPGGEDCEFVDPPGDNFQIPGGGPTCAAAFAAQSDQCINECKPLTPNGCDCFGCCELPAGSGTTVYVGSLDPSKNATCTIADIGDPSKCQPCTQVPSCENTCETCEICIGKDFLPPECFEPPGGSGSGGGGGGTGQICPSGQQQCGLPGQAPCPGGTFCITGCCVPLPQ